MPRLIIFLIIFCLLTVLITKLVLEFPNLDKIVLLYCMLLIAAAMLLIMPEIKKINLFGFGIEKEYPNVIVERDSVKSDASVIVKKTNKKNNKKY